MSDWPWQLTFEVDFTTDPGDTPTTWVDLSSRVRHGVTITYGRPDGGSCRLQLNNRDRALDPTNPSAAYPLDVMRHARVTVDFDGTSYPLWRGFVEEWPPVWPQYTQGLVDIELVDGSAWLALQEADLDLPGQWSGDRIGALLDEADWPQLLRNIDRGRVWLDPLEQESSNLLRAVMDVADAEDADCYFDPAGDLVFRDRHHRLDRTFDFTVGTDGHPVEGVEPVWGAGRVANLARVQLADGRVFEAIDLDSVQRRGKRDRPIRDLDVPKREAVSLAEWEVFRYSEPELWLDRVRIQGRKGLALADLFPARFGDVVRFRHNPPGGGVAEVDGHIDAISHQVGAGRWDVTLDLTPYYGEGPWGVWLDDLAAGDDWWLDDLATSGPRWAP